jgi:plastocyanin
LLKNLSEPKYLLFETIAQNVTGITALANVSSGKVIISIMARNMAFNTSTITVPASSAVTINFDNQDSGIYHNIAIYTDASANIPFFIGMPVIGRSTIA